MKILYVAHYEPEFGGIQRYGEELADGIRRRGHQVDWLNCNPGLRKTHGRPTDWVPRLSTLQRYYWRFRYYLEDYRFHNAVRRVCRERIMAFAPDLVHYLHSFLPTGVPLKRPTVVTCYGLEIGDSPAVRASLTAATGVHSISDFTAARTTASIGPLDTVKVLRWGIRAGANPADGPVQFDLITVGRVVARKNLDTVLRALVGLPNVRYAVVGDGPELPRLKELASALRLANVTFFGAVSDQQREELLAKSRVFIMCPRGDQNEDVEGLGLVYYEAHAHALPVIGSSCGGAPEAIGAGGILVRNAQDPDNVRQAIIRLLDPNQYEAVRRAVLARQRSDSWDRFLDEFEDWYVALAAGCSRAPVKRAVDPAQRTVLS